MKKRIQNYSTDLISKKEMKCVRGGKSESGALDLGGGSCPGPSIVMPIRLPWGPIIKIGPWGRHIF